MKERNGTVLVIGGTGYIGSHMVKLLTESGRKLFVLDDLSTGHRSLLNSCKHIVGKLGDRELLKHIFNENEIIAVMHFAAYSLVGESVSSPLKYYINNITETIALLEEMINHGPMKFIFSSTAAVYGEPKQTPIVENHPCRPTNPYGSTKLCIEKLLRQCDQAYGLKFICLRYSMQPEQIRLQR